MRRLILLPCVAILTAAAPANSAPPAISNPVASPEGQQSVSALGGGNATAAVQEKKICKHLPTSGSRLSNRACLTAKEWKQVEDDLSR
jgi:hypothetical protein